VFNAEIVQLNCNNGNYVEFRVLLNEGKKPMEGFLMTELIKVRCWIFLGC